MWPADRAAFEKYWQESLEQVHIDDTVREFLYPIAANRVRGVRLPGRVQQAADNFALLITTGFLPQRFRDEMRLPWDPERQKRFDRLMAALRTVNHVLPRSGAAVPVQRDAGAIWTGGSGPGDRCRCSEPRTRQIAGVISRPCAPTTTPGTSPRASARRHCSSPPRGHWRPHKPDPLAVDPYAEVFCRAVGGTWSDVLDGEGARRHADDRLRRRISSTSRVRAPRYFDDYFARAADAGVRQIVLLAAGPRLACLPTGLARRHRRLRAGSAAGARIQA